MFDQALIHKDLSSHSKLSVCVESQLLSVLRTMAGQRVPYESVISFVEDLTCDCLQPSRH